jgi:Zn-dependent peptidase ImmA (M78 family)/transcriptional regulator with XRE-family HTH domain
MDDTFEPMRLRLARQLHGWTQAELSRRVGVTPAALSQFESGAIRPGADTRQRLADVLDVPDEFFMLELIDTHEGFFRSLRRTPVADRRKARAVAHIAHDLATHTASDYLPPPQLPRTATPSLGHDASTPEGAAAHVRKAWGLPPGPVPNVVELLESRGIVVMRLPLVSSDVDAFSLPFPDRPIIVLGADKGDRARSRFDAAHELGHLVMHADEVWGMPEVEKQAHAFAAAFLMPANDIGPELPTQADWPQLFALKQKWHVSLAALLLRAKNLGKLPERNYVAAVKTMSARGWRRVEPVPIGDPEQPKLLRYLVESAGLANLRAALPPRVLDGMRALSD